MQMVEQQDEQDWPLDFHELTYFQIYFQCLGTQLWSFDANWIVGFQSHANCWATRLARWSSLCSKCFCPLHLVMVLITCKWSGYMAVCDCWRLFPVNCQGRPGDRCRFWLSSELVPCLEFPSCLALLCAYCQWACLPYRTVHHSATFWASQCTGLPKRMCLLHVPCQNKKSELESSKYSYQLQISASLPLN